MINSRDINELNPKVAKLCRQLIENCKHEGIDIIITSTYRDSESQNALYAQGRTIAGKKVTNAKGGKSFHNWRCAFDFVPILNGKAQWSDIATFERVGVIGEKLGLTWSGRFAKFPERAHFQFTNGLTLTDFQLGKTF
jgi:peptidoglycan L-alanyl-D-glutamate endopeptidase CwlK